MKVNVITKTLLIGILGVGLIACNDDEPITELPPPATSYNAERVSIAPIDEIYFGRASALNEFLPYASLSQADADATIQPAKARRNAAYAWGVAQVDDKIWFGSLNNGWCGWMMKHLKLPMMVTAFDSEVQACNLVDIPRPGQLYIYDVTAAETKVINPNDIHNAAGQSYADDIAFGPSKYLGNNQFEGNSPKTYGFRSAGSHNGIVFFIGHANLDQSATDAAEGFLRVFAFDSQTQTYLGKADFPFDSSRRMTVLTHPDGSQALYTFMGPDTSLGQAGTSGTVGLRWVAKDKLKPFNGGDIHGFDIVTDQNFHYEGLPGEFVTTKDEHDNERLVVSTWAHPKASKDANYQGGNLLASNPMPDAGFSKTNPLKFNTIFKTEDFDADPVIAKSYEMGAMTLYQGYLYFGSMHVGHSGGYDKLKAAYPDAFPAIVEGTYSRTEKDLAVRSWRASSLFRMKMDSFTTPGQFKPELLYGDEKQWTFDGNKWVQKPNRMGLTPKYGPAGWGEVLNVYAWTAVVHQDKLYYGGFDLGSGMRDYFDNIRGIQTQAAGLGTLKPDQFCLPGQCIPVDMMGGKGWYDQATNNPMYYVYEWAQKLPSNSNKSGADLIVFEDTDSAAKVITQDGFGNRGNNGIRNAAVIDGELYLGTSSFSNLGDNAGFEYYKLSANAPK